MTDPVTSNFVKIKDVTQRPVALNVKYIREADHKDSLFKVSENYVPFSSGPIPDSATYKASSGKNVTVNREDQKIISYKEDEGGGIFNIYQDKDKNGTFETLVTESYKDGKVVKSDTYKKTFDDNYSRYDLIQSKKETQ